VDVPSLGDEEGFLLLKERRCGEKTNTKSAAPIEEGGVERRRTEKNESVLASF